jgi:hypothetical protein
MFPVEIISPRFSTSYIADGMDNRPVDGRSSEKRSHAIDMIINTSSTTYLVFISHNSVVRTTFLKTVHLEKFSFSLIQDKGLYLSVTLSNKRKHLYMSNKKYNFFRIKKFRIILTGRYWI